MLKRNIIRNSNQPGRRNTIPDDPFHDADILRKTTPGCFAKARRRSNFLVVLALRKRSLAAVETVTAGAVMKRHHSIAHREPLHAVADRSNRSGHLVPEHPRCRMRPRVNLLQVCAADPARIDLYQHLTVSNRWNHQRLDSNIIRRAIHRRLHRRRNRCIHHASSLEDVSFSQQAYIYEQACRQ